MDSGLMLLAFVCAFAVGFWLFKRNEDQSPDSDEQLIADKEYRFSFLCVFDNEDKARELCDKVAEEPLESSVSLSSNGEKWWASFTLNCTPESGQHTRVESILIDRTQALGGKYGYTDVQDPSATGTSFE